MKHRDTQASGRGPEVSIQEGVELFVGLDAVSMEAAGNCLFGARFKSPSSAVVAHLSCQHSECLGDYSAGPVLLDRSHC